MKNLAQDQGCDAHIAKELARSRIPAVSVEKTNTEVPYRIIGQLGEFTFKRGWYYWVVKGAIPFEIAKELYADPVGKTDIRFNGHAAGPDPETIKSRRDDDNLCVYDAHIDTEVGLRLFADTLKHHGLA